MPQVMKMEFAKPGSLERDEPYAAAEVGVTKRPAFRAGEHKPFGAWLGETGEVPLDDRNDHFGNRYHASACLGLGRAEREPAAAYFGQLADRKSTRLNSSHLVISYAV